MESQRVNGKPVNAPEVGEVVLVVGEEKNRSEWKKGRVVRQVKGKDGVVRGVVLLHKGHTIERPLQLVCPLEIRCTTQIEQRKNEENQTVEKERKKWGAAIEAKRAISSVERQWNINNIETTSYPGLLRCRSPGYEVDIETVTFSYPEPFLRAFDRARRGALAKSIIG
jgi:hypothetical protein